MIRRLPSFKDELAHTKRLWEAAYHTLFDDFSVGFPGNCSRAEFVQLRIVHKKYAVYGLALVIEYKLNKMMLPGGNAGGVCR